MKHILPALIFILVITTNLSAQNPLVKQWDKRFGGTFYDQLYSFKQTADGGYILGGLTASDSSGDKTQNTWGLEDYWIVKIDSLGNKQWDRDFGGNHSDYLLSLQQTTDGGYILGGLSDSDISGDKTQTSWNVSYDYWIVKIDSLGNKQWDKDIGGTSMDRLQSLQQTADGGYILGGYSYSNSNGDKTQNNWDSTTTDYWIVKTDSQGNKEWDKDFGGTGYDWLNSIYQTSDGGYILGGVSYSDSSGDKTQNSWGDLDYWIIKTDSLGNKQWDKDFGGTLSDGLISLQQTADGGYILAGWSESDSSGVKTQNSWGGYDYWIVKTDASGNIQWQHTIGGSSNEILGSIEQTNDNGFLIAGFSLSPISGDKTENNMGPKQTWIVKTDSLGTIQWDKTIFTMAQDESGMAIQTKDGYYAIANWTYAGIGGYKTEPTWGNSVDYWIIKFCDTTVTTAINSTVLSNNGSLVVAPNPFTTSVSVTIQKQNVRQATFIIRNVFGQVVYRNQENKLSSNYTKSIELSYLSSGIYFLEVIADGERMASKLIKE